MQIVRCWQCGEFITKDVSELAKGSSKGRLFCPECKNLFEKTREDTKQEYIRLKTLVTLERAMRIIEKQARLNVNTDDYFEPFEVVSEFLKKDSTKFESAHEIVACMELLRNEVHVKAQQSVGRKRIDFILPDLKVALEIDGGLHKFQIGKDSQRDIYVLNELNKNEKGWEIVRIPTSMIEKDITKLMPAIKAIYKEKQELRRKYNGFIPSYYSRSNKMAHIAALNGILSDKELDVLTKETLSSEEINNLGY